MTFDPKEWDTRFEEFCRGHELTDAEFLDYFREWLLGLGYTPTERHLRVYRYLYRVNQSLFKQSR